MYNYMAIMHAR